MNPDPTPGSVGCKHHLINAPACRQAGQCTKVLSMMDDFHHPFFTGFRKRIAVQQPPHAHWNSSDYAPFPHYFFRIFRASGGVATVSVRVQMSERPMVGRERMLVDRNKAHNQIARKIDNTACSEACEESFHAIEQCFHRRKVVEVVQEIAHMYVLCRLGPKYTPFTHFL